MMGRKDCEGEGGGIWWDVRDVRDMKLPMSMNDFEHEHPPTPPEKFKKCR